MASITDILLKDAVVVIETSVSPPITVDLYESASGPPSPLAGLLKPKITLFRKGASQPLLVSAPYGEPDSAYVLTLLVIGVAGILVALMFLRSSAAS
jgi:hypothetical protein